MQKNVMFSGLAQAADPGLAQITCEGLAQSENPGLALAEERGRPLLQDDLDMTTSGALAQAANPGLAPATRQGLARLQDNLDMTYLAANTSTPKAAAPVAAGAPSRSVVKVEPPPCEHGNTVFLQPGSEPVPAPGPWPHERQHHKEHNHHARKKMSSTVHGSVSRDLQNLEFLTYFFKFLFNYFAFC